MVENQKKNIKRIYSNCTKPVIALEHCLPELCTEIEEKPPLVILEIIYLDRQTERIAAADALQINKMLTAEGYCS